MATTTLQAGPNTPIATPSDVEAVAADLRYRIAEAVTPPRLPTGVTVKYDENSVSSYFLTYDASTNKWSMTITVGETTQTADMEATWDAQGIGGSGFAGDSAVVLYGADGTELMTPPDLVFSHLVEDRMVNLITASDETSIDIELPAAVTVDGVRYCRDFILDIDNSANAGDLALEFTALDVDYAFVPLEDDSISEMMTIGAGERVRLYFTETPYHATGSLPVINVARVTLGDFVTSTTTQGGN